MVRISLGRQARKDWDRVWVRVNGVPMPRKNNRQARDAWPSVHSLSSITVVRSRQAWEQGFLLRWRDGSSKDGRVKLSYLFEHEWEATLARDLMKRGMSFEDALKRTRDHGMRIGASETAPAGSKPGSALSTGRL